jgi:hypothetical protein
MTNQKRTRSPRELESDRVVGVNLELKEVRKDTESDIVVKGDRISLKALAVISSWNQYSNQSTLSKVYHKIVNSIRRK